MVLRLLSPHPGGTRMRNVKIFAASVALVSFAVVPAYTAQRGSSGSHGPSTKQGPSTTSHGPSTPKGTTTTTHGPSKPSSGATTTTKGASPKASTRPVKVETKVAKADHVKVAKTSTTSTTTTTG